MHGLLASNGDDKARQRLSLVLHSGERMRVEKRYGPLESAVALLNDQRPSLLVMLSPEREPKLEARGASQSERVLQTAKCPRLIVPASRRSGEYASS